MTNICGLHNWLFSLVHQKMKNKCQQLLTGLERHEGKTYGT